MSGYWTSAGNRIVLEGDLAANGGVVRHEMLHVLIREPGHPARQFLGTCAGVVDCEDECARESGSMAVPSDAVPVDPDSLEVSIAVSPTTPTTAIDEGFFMITVTARNRFAVPVVVTLPINTRQRTFWFDIRGPEGGLSDGPFSVGPSSITFLAGETKRQIFDFSIGHELQQRRMTPGAYVIRGGFSSKSTPSIEVAISH